MSNKISLLPGEQIVTSSNNDVLDDVLVLTTNPVRYDFVVWGRSSLISSEAIIGFIDALEREKLK